MRHKLIILVGLLFPLVVNSAVFLVNSTADLSDQNPGDGICLNTAGRCSLRAALEEANALAGAETIYLPRNNIFQNTLGELLINDPLTLSIENPATPAETVFELPQIAGATNSRVFRVENTTEVTFLGVLIRDGDATQNPLGDQDGGGIKIENLSQFNLFNSIVYSNRALRGGGIETKNVDNVIISLSDISYNQNVNSGGHGVALDHSGVSNGDFRIQYSTIHHNTIDNPTQLGCSWSVKKEQNTGDMYIFSSNISDGGDAADPFACVGGVFAESSNFNATSHLYIINGTIINHSGTGLDFADYGPFILGSLFVRNSIMSANAVNCDSSMIGIINFGDVNGGHNLASDTSCAMPTGSGNIENTDPMLNAAKSIFPIVDFLFIYYEPFYSSPAVDSGSSLPVNVGNPNACQQYDLLFRERPIDGDGNGQPICDRGAVEYTDVIFVSHFE